MEQYNMRSNFYPAKEPINGYIGHADILISNIIRLQGIAVFKNSDKPGHHIQFPGFGDNGSYVVPHSAEAYAQMLDVVEKAIADEKHFGHVAGKPNPQLSVSGQAVNEPYADARFALDVGDICTIHGITTREVTYENNGKKSSFVSVDAPNLPPYEKNGEKVYPPIFKGLKSTYEVEGVQRETDYAQVIRGMVINERKNILAKPPLENQMDDAAQKAGQAAPGKEGPAQEAQR